MNKLKFFALFLLAGLLGIAHATELPASVKTALQQAHIPLSGVGIEVREVNSDNPLLSVNAERPMNPASTMKLLTTYAGLELLGPAYAWKTEAWLDGKLDHGVLQGNLVLKGYGDPDLTLEQFWLWLRELRSRGLQEIRGNLVLDRSAFQLPRDEPAEFDNDPMRAYNVGPDALLLNFNALRLHYIPDGEKVAVITEPDLANTPLVNRVVAASRGDCSNWNDNIFPQVSGGTLLLQGSFPAKCGEREQYLSLLPHSTYLFAVFRALWQELGGKLGGEVRDGNVPIDATLFATHLSASLSEQIRDINKFSNNVMARQLFLSLSLSNEAPASIERSEQIIRDWLDKKGLRFPDLVLENGAGLSRKEHISAQEMALLLQTAQHSPFQSELEASLPIIGIDGTLKKRLFNNPATGHAHLKTGTLDGVKTVAGYVQGRDGRQWVVAFFINHPNAAAGQAAQDALIEWVQGY
jgi:D-alanyl-D-alanine carboxypeptidase/D-alanyl-D-alanine-endopeptidase (penicillin-binding protein 4)